MEMEPEALVQRISIFVLSDMTLKNGQKEPFQLVVFDGFNRRRGKIVNIKK